MIGSPHDRRGGKGEYDAGASYSRSGCAGGIAGSGTGERDDHLYLRCKGRLMKVEHSGTVNNNVKAEYTHDKADNRTNVKVSGATS